MKQNGNKNYSLQLVTIINRRISTLKFSRLRRFKYIISNIIKFMVYLEVKNSPIQSINIFVRVQNKQKNLIYIEISVVTYL